MSAKAVDCTDGCGPVIFEDDGTYTCGTCGSDIDPAEYIQHTADLIRERGGFDDLADRLEAAAEGAQDHT